MTANDATQDVIADYELPAEMTATGEIVDGGPHVHAVMAVEGDRAISGHFAQSADRHLVRPEYLLVDS
jgi:predicted DNA-binding protein with PD1-like motif